MLHHALPAALLALAAPFAAAMEPMAVDGATDGVTVTQFSFHQRVVIRVPRITSAPQPRVAPVRYKEKRGPRCIAADDLRGAMIADNSAIDLVLNGGRRLRAKLDGDCGPLDFYSGFYIKPAADGTVCADRDVIRARSGAACQINVFRTLKPRR